MLLDVRDEFCDAVSGKRKSAILDVILRGLSTHTNLNKPCPMKPGDGEFYIKDFNFGIEHWPSFIPEGRYIMNASLRGESNNFIAYLQIYFEVTNHGILDLRVG